MKKRIIFLGILVLTVLLIMLGVRTIRSSAQQNSEERKPLKICYEIYVVSVSDTLWSISEKNASRLRMTTKSYVEEIKRANGMQNDRILTGGKLILPYGIYD